MKQRQRGRHAASLVRRLLFAIDQTTTTGVVHINRTVQTAPPQNAGGPALTAEPPSRFRFRQDLAALLATTLLSALTGLLLLLTGPLSATALLPATLLTALSGLLLLLLTGTGILLVRVLLVRVLVRHSHHSSRLHGTLPRAHWIKREDYARVSCSEKENVRSDRRIRRKVGSNLLNVR
jgi:hypothetical protein